MAKDKLGHGSEAHRNLHKPQVEHGEYKEGTDFHHHMRKIAERTLKMPDAMVGVMGGPNKAQARKILRGK